MIEWKQSWKKLKSHFPQVFVVLLVSASRRQEIEKRAVLTGN